MHRLAATAACFALSVTACGADPPALIGHWVSGSIGGLDPNRLTVEDDLRGESTIYFYIDDVQYYAEFDVDCDSCGERFCCAMSCTGCSDFDFVMTCPDSEPSMRCSGSGAFSEFAFVWEKR